MPTWMETNSRAGPTISLSSSEITSFQYHPSAGFQGSVIAR